MNQDRPDITSLDLEEVETFDFTHTIIYQWHLHQDLKLRISNLNWQSSNKEEFEESLDTFNKTEIHNFYSREVLAYLKLGYKIESLADYDYWIEARGISSAQIDIYPEFIQKELRKKYKSENPVIGVLERTLKARLDQFAGRMLNGALMSQVYTEVKHCIKDFGGANISYSKIADFRFQVTYDLGDEHLSLSINLA